MSFGNSNPKLNGFTKEATWWSLTPHFVPLIPEVSKLSFSLSLLQLILPALTKSHGRNISQKQNSFIWISFFFRILNLYFFIIFYVPGSFKQIFFFIYYPDFLYNLRRWVGQYFFFVTRVEVSIMFVKINFY